MVVAIITHHAEDDQMISDVMMNPDTSEYAIQLDDISRTGVAELNVPTAIAVGSPGRSTKIQAVVGESFQRKKFCASGCVRTQPLLGWDVMLANLSPSPRGPHSFPGFESTRALTNAP